MCGRAAAKYIVYSVYRFIGCIIDQSKWSGPFSLVVMTPDFHPGNRGLRPALATGLYFSSFYIWCLVPGQDDYCWSPRAKMSAESKSAWE